jgi:hypothetical protein
MVSAVRIYVEGGGDSNVTRAKLRTGFNLFLSELHAAARANRIGWSVIACGGRQAAYDDFCIALREHPEAFNVLLVDSEKPVAAKRPYWLHLKDLGAWDCPAGVTDEQCFLMVQSMETWLIADRDALAKYYGQGFLMNASPRTANVESIDKVQLYDALLRATVNTRSKGEYHKTNHAFEILATVKAGVVRERAPECKRLFSVLAEKVGAALDD